MEHRIKAKIMDGAKIRRAFQHMAVLFLLLGGKEREIPD